MKLKNLFTCTVTGLLLCTSCIKDEAPNAEADILNCILPAEMLTGTDIDYNRPYDKSLNAYPIYIEVNNGTDLTRLAPTFELLKEHLSNRPTEVHRISPTQCAIP